MRLFDRLSALTGLLGVALYAVGSTVAGPPLDLNPTTDADTIAYELGARAGRAQAGAWCLLAAALLVMVFAARFHGSLRRRTAADDWVPTLALVAGAVLAGTMLLDAGIQFALGEGAGYDSDTQVAKVLFLYGWNSTYTYAPSAVGLVLAGTTVGFRAHTFPVWFRWLGVLVLALLVVVLVIGPSAGSTALPSLLWVAVASVVVALGRQEYAAR